MKAEKNLLIIFTRNPEPGKVKKRLAADIGDRAALEVYKMLLERTARITRNLPFEKIVYYSEAVEQEDCWENAIFQKRAQKGADLGERMENAFRENFDDGYSHIAIIGSDIYELQQQDIWEAFRALEQNDAVLGPAPDGGYYLLGMNSLNSAVFKNKAWSTDRVLQDTLEDLKNKKIKMLQARNDIDFVKDLNAYPELQQYTTGK